MRTSPSPTFEAGKLHGLPVIAVIEGRVLGRVKELVFDPVEHRMLGVLVSRHRGNRDDNFVDVHDVDCLGPFAVTLNREVDLQDVVRNPRASEIINAGVRFRGAPVITDAGQPVGHIAQIWITPGGLVERYVVTSGLGAFGRRLDLAPADFIVIGEDAAVVRGSTLAERGHAGKTWHLSSLRREPATSAAGVDERRDERG